MPAKNTHIKKNTASSFGHRLREAREEKDLTKDKLGKLVKVHYSQIGRYERNEASPSADVLKKIANALDVTADYLMNGTTADLAAEMLCAPTALMHTRAVATAG